MNIYADLEELSHAAAKLIVNRTEHAVDKRGVCALVLAGGSTPRRLYELLASTYRKQVPWSHMRIFWGDERFVPHDHKASNYRMAQDAMLRHVSLSASQVHPIPTGGTPSGAAARYDDLLDAFSKQRKSGPLFDIVLLGIGDDGHTASIFPSTLETLRDPSRRVISVEAPAQYSPRRRISLTPNAINNTSDAIFLVSGASKKRALRQAQELQNPKLPASHVKAKNAVHWLVDEEAAG